MGAVDLNCWRPHSVTATKPGVTDCDGRSQILYPKTGRQQIVILHNFIGVVKRDLNKIPQKLAWTFRPLNK